MRCSAISFGKFTKSTRSSYQGKLIEDNHFLVKDRCKNGGPQSLYRDDKRFGVCGQHNNMNACLIASLGHVLQTTAVIENEDGVTHIDLKSGVETTQERLPLEKEKTMNTIEVTVYWIKKVEGHKFFYLEQANRKVISFGACAQELVDHRPEGVIGFIIRRGTQSWKVAPNDASNWKEITGSIMLKKFRAPKAPKVPNPVTCAKCTTWVDGKKVEVKHATTNDVRRCFLGEDVPAVKEEV